MKQNKPDKHSSANLLEQTINDWKYQSKTDHEIRIWELTPLPKNVTEFKLELSIIAAIMVEWEIEYITVNAEPFYVKALADNPPTSESLNECNNLKRLMNEIDDNFKHQFQMKKG